MATTKIVLDDFVKNVRPDPKSTEPIIFMSGFLGESPIEGHVRVYGDPQLSSFNDVPRSAILHAVQNAKEGDSLGGSKLWIRQGGVSNAGGFLEGDLYGNYAGTMYQPGGGIQPPQTIVQIQCTRTTPVDPVCGRLTIPGPCFTIVNYLCPTRFKVRSLCSPCFTHTASLCHTSICCPKSIQIFCPPPITANIPCQFETYRCPSIVDGCPTAPTDPTIYQGGQGPVVNPTYTGSFNPYTTGGY